MSLKLRSPRQFFRGMTSFQTNVIGLKWNLSIFERNCQLPRCLDRRIIVRGGMSDLHHRETQRLPQERLIFRFSSVVASDSFKQTVQIQRVANPREVRFLSWYSCSLLPQPMNKTSSVIVCYKPRLTGLPFEFVATG
jgi:hypothetical protein